MPATIRLTKIVEALETQSAEARLLKASVAIQKQDYVTAQDQVDKVLKNSPELSNQAPTPREFPLVKVTVRNPD
jgi:outer membrane PBP1 activator LpoA protein